MMVVFSKGMKCYEMVCFITIGELLKKMINLVCSKIFLVTICK